jgi:hypothetical protein
MNGRFSFDARGALAVIVARRVGSAAAVPAVVAVPETTRPQEPQEPQPQSTDLAFARLQAAYKDEPIDADAVEERAALASDRVPVCYLEAWARLNHKKPAQVSEAYWRIALNDGGRFLDRWGCEAAELGWTPAELFEARAGLIWRLYGESVEAIYADHVELERSRVILRQETRGFR